MSEETRQILITVIIYDSTPEEAVRALRELKTGFDLPGGAEMEIIGAQLVPEPEQP